MGLKGISLTAMCLAVTISFLLMTAQGAVASTVAPAGHSNHPKKSNELSVLVARGGTPVPGVTAMPKIKYLCSVPPGENPGGVYPIKKYFAFVEEWNDGQLWNCENGYGDYNGYAPYPSTGYYGLAGVNVSGELDLILISYYGVGWYLIGDHLPGTGFTLPSSFCASEPAGYCNPDGLVVESNLSFTYVDAVNQQMVTCTAYAASCSVDAASSAFAGYQPVNIAQSGSTLAVSDNSCAGVVWEGSTSSMTVVASIGDALQGITFHHKQLYVADDGTCTNTIAHIIDLTTGRSLRTPLTAPDEIIGLDWELQFSAFDANVVYSE